MENITLAQIATVIAFIVALYGGVKYLKRELKEGISELSKEQFVEIDRKLDNDNKRIVKLKEDIDDIKKAQVETLKALRTILDELSRNNDVDGKIDKAKSELDEFLINR